MYLDMLVHSYGSSKYNVFGCKLTHCVIKPVLNKEQAQ